MRKMTRDQIFNMIESDSKIFIRSSDAFPALLDLLVDLANVIRDDDLATLAALSGMLFRAVEAENDVHSIITAIQRRVKQADAS